MLHTILIKFIYISKRKIFLDVYYIIKNLNLYKIKNIMVRFGEVDAIKYTKVITKSTRYYISK